jgi:hypothetical protein
LRGRVDRLENAAMQIFSIFSLVAVLNFIVSIAAFAKEPPDKARVSKQVTIFVPGSSFFPRSGMEMGLYVELKPNGRYLTMEALEGGPPMQCRGLYEIKAHDLVLKGSDCTLFGMPFDTASDIKKNRGPQASQVITVKRQELAKVLAEHLLSPDRALNADDPHTKINIAIKKGKKVEASRDGVMYLFEGSLAQATVEREEKIKGTKSRNSKKKKRANVI